MPNPGTERTWPEHKSVARFGRAHARAWLGRSASTPHRFVRPTAPESPKTDIRVIHLFGAAGAIMPLVLLSLQKDLSPHLGSDHLVSALRVLFWPASALAIGMQWSLFILACIYALNVATYLVVGGLVWLGLQPRSIPYLTIVGIIYLIVVSLAGFCEWLLA